MTSQDTVFIQTISMIAENYGCHLTNVDVCLDKNGKRIGLIEIDGPEENQVALAQAIDEAKELIQ